MAGNMHGDLHLPTTSLEGQARASALEAVQGRTTTPTTLVSYASKGTLLIIGNEQAAQSVAARLHDSGLTPTVLVPIVVAESPARPAQETSTDSSVSDRPQFARVLKARVARVYGHLGDFRVRALHEDGEADLVPSILTAHRPFDLVLDLCDPAWIAVEVPPPGYFAANSDAHLNAALSALPELVGEFEKPRYFDYDASICAHGRAGIAGCNKCIDACPTGAITSIRESVQVDPFLCQGGGACATVCPSGAMTYAYPGVGDLLGGLQHALEAYHARGGLTPVILFVDAEQGAQWLATAAQDLPENVIPWTVEEVASVGLDAWLAALAYGASMVLLHDHDGVTSPVRRAVDAQIQIAQRLLVAMGYASGLIRWSTGAALAGVTAGEMMLPPAAGGVPSPRATFAVIGEKRTTLRLALDHLHSNASLAPEVVDLPAEAPFGEVLVDRDACTLCMACASVCPAGALQAGGDTPALRFIEWNCVQCGICERACPENAITRTPRFIFDHVRRSRPSTLHEEPPFPCVHCGKLFATQAVIDRMRAKLSGHWMYQQPEALRRLEMCEECRVKDMFTAQRQQPSP